MRSVNKVILVGNLTRDPEMRQTPNGQSVVTFGLATNREWATKNGERKNSAEFHECVAWARLAEICSQHLKKGQLVYVEGYLKTRSWDSLDGVRKFKTEIVVKDMIRLEKRNREEGGDYNDYIPEEEENVFGNYDEEVSERPIAEAPSYETPAYETPSYEAPAEPAPTVTPEEETNQKEDPINRDLGL